MSTLLLTGEWNWFANQHSITLNHVETTCRLLITLCFVCRSIYNLCYLAQWSSNLFLSKTFELWQITSQIQADKTFAFRCFIHKVLDQWKRLIETPWNPFKGPWGVLRPHFENHWCRSYSVNIKHIGLLYNVDWNMGNTQRLKQLK